MSIIGFIFKATGIMPKKEILRKCKALGEATAKLTMKESKPSIDNISSIIQQQLGKRADKINIARDKESFIQTVKENIDIPEEFIEKAYNSTLSATMPNLKGKTLMNLRIDNMEREYIPNLVAHEYEHTLFYTYGLKSKIQKFLLNMPFIKRILPKDSEKYIASGNRAALNFQTHLMSSIGKFDGGSCVGMANYSATIEGLLKQCGCESKQALHDRIREMLYTKGILHLNDNKYNRNILHFLKASLKDESRAYKAGAMGDKAMYELMGLETNGIATKSEMNSLLYKEALEVINKEAKHIRNNCIRAKFGLKQKTESETKIYNTYKENMRKNILESLKQSNSAEHNLSDVLGNFF